MKTATTELDNLRRLTADNAEQQTRLDTLDKLIVTKTDQLKVGIQSYQQGDRDKALAAINTHEARETLTDIRAQIEAFITTERDLFGRAPGARRKPSLRPSDPDWRGLLVATILAGTLAVSTRQALRGLIERTAELEEGRNSAAKPRSRCGRRRRWKPSASSPAASRTTSTIC